MLVREHVLRVTPVEGHLAEFRECNLIFVPGDGETDCLSRFQGAVTQVVHETRDRNRELGDEEQLSPVLEVYPPLRDAFYRLEQRSGITNLLELPPGLTVRAVTKPGRACPPLDERPVKLAMVPLEAAGFCKLFYVTQQGSGVTIQGLLLDGSYRPKPGEHIAEGIGGFDREGHALIFHGNENRTSKELRQRPVCPLLVTDCRFVDCAGDGVHAFNTRSQTSITRCTSASCFRGAITASGEAESDVLYVADFRAEPRLAVNNRGHHQPTDGFNHEPNLHWFPRSRSFVTIRRSHFANLQFEVRGTTSVNASEVTTESFDRSLYAGRSFSVHAATDGQGPLQAEVRIDGFTAPGGIDVQLGANARLSSGTTDHVAVTNPVSSRPSTAEMSLELVQVEITGATEAFKRDGELALTTTLFDASRQGLATITLDRCRWSAPVLLHSAHLRLVRNRSFGARARRAVRSRLRIFRGLRPTVRVDPVGESILRIVETFTGGHRNQPLVTEHTEAGNYW